MKLLFGIIPLPTPLQPRSRVYDLKARLDWGDPALTIIDVRDRCEFAINHIMGAVNLPLAEMIDRALINFELTRDIYICGDTNEEIAIAAAQLRAAGYLNVSEVQGGLPAWKAVGYPVERGAFQVQAA
jgi:rhodanese-related sulfurtransferase